MAILDNYSSPQATQTVGVKISQPGTDARTASAGQLIFNSSWPSLAVVFRKIIPMPTDYNLQTIPHNLGFAPFIRLWILDSNYNPVNNLNYLYANWGVDTQNVYFVLSNYSIGSYIYIELYNIDLSVDIDYPALPYVQYKSFYDSNYGIKVSKDGKSSNSTDPRNFILHSRYRSPLVKAVKTEATINSSNAGIIVGSNTESTIQYTNQDNIPTWNYGFIKKGSSSLSLQLPSGAYEYAPYYAQSYPVTTTDGIKTSVTYITNSSFGQDLGATIVVLRDPLIASNTVAATY